MENVSLFIGTPAYNSMLHTDYLHSIIDFHKNSFDVTVMTIGNESLVPRGRNSIITYFYNLEKFTHLLFLDADMFLSFKQFYKLLSHDKDVIGAPVALKGFDKDNNPVYNVGKLLSQIQPNLVTVDRIGTAVLLLSRKAVTSLVEDAIKNNQVYDPNPHSRGIKMDKEHYNIFQTGITDGEYDSEDFFVCRSLMRLGYDIYVDPTCETRHNGMYRFL